MVRSRGYTIIEVVIVLMIVGIALALAVPRLARITAISSNTRQRVIGLARQTAIHRAQTLSLVIGQDGRWILSELATSDGVLAKGVIAERDEMMQLNVSPAGICIPNAEGGQKVLVIDPVSCTVLQTLAAAR